MFAALGGIVDDLCEDRVVERPNEKVLSRFEGAGIGREGGDEGTADVGGKGGEVGGREFWWPPIGRAGGGGGGAISSC